LIVLVLLIQ